MIGHVSIGASFYHCISYCLEDKRELSEEQKQRLSENDALQHRERAEVLEYNKCFGNKHELTEQFKDVQKLSRRIEKPVLHLSLRLAPGESLTKDQLIEIGRSCAKEFGIAENQYICVLHKDTKEQHIHIAANRVGFDGKVANDSNSYKRMAALCRNLEKQYHLKEVLSPRAFLSAKDRALPRYDNRKEKLKTDIRNALEKATLYSTFEQQMKARGYKVVKGRGISFIDNKKVKIKGSEVGFSLGKIEKILSLKQQLEMSRSGRRHNYKENTLLNKSSQISPRQTTGRNHVDEMIDVVEKQLSGTLYQLMKPEYEGDHVNPELIKEVKRKRRSISISR